MTELSTVLAEAQERAMREAMDNTDNGCQGYWRVEGIRHECTVKASSALEAIEKADAAGRVGKDWEFPQARFLYEELPDVI